jgi:hypothetical protein
MDAACMEDPFRRKGPVKNLVITRKNTCNQKYSMLY